MLYQLALGLLISLLILPPIYALLLNNPALWIFWLAFVALIAMCVSLGQGDIPNG